MAAGRVPSGCQTHPLSEAKLLALLIHRDEVDNKGMTRSIPADRASGAFVLSTSRPCGLVRLEHVGALRMDRQFRSTGNDPDEPAKDAPDVRCRRKIVRVQLLRWYP